MPAATLSLTPIGAVRGGRATPEDDNWGGVETVIALDPDALGPQAVAGLDAFSHRGLSRCRLLRVEGLDLYVADLDAIDGTPVLDVKPWMAEFGPRGAVRQPAWAVELMRSYY
jgi:tRNA (Thr-GGU) A37 N-methylase